ncbi:MAG TPA: hybrid sensor histidine kinase/response regulator [Polyangiaceae bacterium]|nr:hybrid sensor histidine kinase/response regulator [Polyangiaceae bacterium]
MIQRSREPVKFLIVDDLDENLLALEALLRRDDLEILKARSGREALELLLVHDVGLALIDVQMPEMDGFELAELMRGAERTRRIPIIFVTAGIQESNRIFQGYDAGAVDFLFKPIEPKILRHKTETFFELHRQRQDLAETLRLTEELVAVVGHDLRNPLNVVLMTATVLSGSTSEPETRKAAERLRSSGTRMVQIIDELFDLARARLGGGIPIERRPVNLGLIAKKTVSEFEATTPERKIELQLSGDLSGIWDEGRLEQVLSNLIGNAVRHGSLDAPIVVDVAGPKSEVCISVHNGGRISPDLLPRIFEPFRSGRRRRGDGDGDGLGLGLYIVQQIVHAHGGTVTVDSTEQGGTTFHVHLPRGASLAAL